MLVLMAGVFLFLILLPFTFVHFFLPTMVGSTTKNKNHIIITNLDPVTDTLTPKLQRHNYDYVIIQPDLNQAKILHKLGYNIIVGDYEYSETFRKVRIEQSLLAAPKLKKSL